MRRSLLIAVGIVVVAGCVWIAPEYGLSWDEPVRWNGGDRKLEYTAYLLGLSDDPDATRVRRDLYPGFFDMNLAWLRRVSPLSDWATSRFFNLAFGLLGVLGAALLAERLRRGAGVWAAGFLLLYPGWFGHMFINPKDIPFAAMYVLSLWALGGFILESDRRRSRRWLIGFALLAGLTAATRVPGLILFVYLGAAMGALAMRRILLTRPQPVKAAAELAVDGVRGGAAVIIGFLALLPWWPYLHGNPLARTAEAVAGVTHFDWEFPVLFWGNYTPAQELPISYLPTWALLTTPLALFAVAAIAVHQVYCRMRSLDRPVDDATARRSILAGIIVFAIVFPIGYILARNATLYNGLRHVLFLVPPVIALAAAGWARWWDRGWPAASRIRRSAIAAVLALAYLPVAFDMVRLHPYQYTYFNEIAGGVGNASRHFETEYWGTSYKEAARELIAWLDETRLTGEVVVNMEHPTWLMTHHLPEDDDRPYRVRVVRSQGKDADFYVANTVWHSHTWWAGEIIGTVERMGAVFCVIKDRRHLEGEEREMYYGME